MQLVQERGFKAPQLCLIYTDLCISIATKNIFKYCTIFHNQNNTSTLMWGGGGRWTGGEFKSGSKFIL